MKLLSKDYYMAAVKRLSVFPLAAALVLGSSSMCFAESEFPEDETAVEFASEVPAEDEDAYPDEAPAEEDYEELLKGYEYEDVFAEWDPDAPALQVLIDYVDAVTDEASPDYIPVEDRIAVFDMDGTLYGELFPTYLEYYMLAWRILEDPSIEPDAEMLDLGRELRDSVSSHHFADDLPIRHAIQAARAYAGMTLNEFADFVTEILLRDVDGFEGMTYGEAFYQPMIEVVEYLQDNDFTVFVVSGSDRFICRTLIEGALDVPYDHIIGMDVAMVASGQEDTDGLDYVFKADDELIRSDKLLIKNLKMNKVSQIARDIGRQPVLSFGNSSGDVSMHMYTISNNPYRSEAFMLIANDEERDYGNAEKAEKLGEEWEADGFNVISMRDDFLTIYGDGVVKTGTFRWDDEMADNREYPEDIDISYAEGAADAEEFAEGAEAADETETAGEADAFDEAMMPADIETLDGGGEMQSDIETIDGSGFIEESEPESAAGSEDIQYVMYLGTNSQTTGSAVCGPEEAKEIVKSVLIKYFGGYTLQDASGGWVDDDGTLYQEYTVVIYLSDTTDEQVHAAADELIQVFDQSSILIQRNPTNTEFYSGF